MSKTALTNKGRFSNNSKIATLISFWLSVENKVKLSQLEIINKQYHREDVLSSSWDSFALFSSDNRFEISASTSLLLQNLHLFYPVLE